MMRPVKRSNDTSTPVKLMTMINRVIGLRPFDDPKGQPRILLSLPYLAVLWFIMGASATFMYGLEASHQNVEEYTSLLSFYPFVASGFCSTFLGYYNSKKFFVYQKKMLKVDHTLHRLGASLEYRASSVIPMIEIITCFLLIVVWCCDAIEWVISQAGVPLGLCGVCGYFYTTNISGFVYPDFVISIRSVKLRFEKVNDLLEVFTSDGFQTKENNFPSRALLPVIPLRLNNWIRLRKNFTTLEHSLRTEGQWEYIEKRNWRLRLIKMVHLELCQASILLFQTFGAQIALQIRLGVLAITLTLYYIYFNTGRKLLTAQSLMHVFWPIASCIVEVLRLFLLCRTCEHACREADKALSFVHACRPSSNDVVMKDEIRQFALQLSHCRRGCTRRYFAGLNYSLLSRYAGAITTYLVILVQMDQDMEPNNPSMVVNNSMLDAHEDP